MAMQVILNSEGLVISKGQLRKHWLYLQNSMGESVDKKQFMTHKSIDYCASNEDT